MQRAALAGSCQVIHTWAWRVEGSGQRVRELTQQARQAFKLAIKVVDVLSDGDMQ